MVHCGKTKSFLLHSYETTSSTITSQTSNFESVSIVLLSIRALSRNDFFFTNALGSSSPPCKKIKQKKKKTKPVDRSYKSNYFTFCRTFQKHSIIELLTRNKDRAVTSTRGPPKPPTKARILIWDRWLFVASSDSSSCLVVASSRWDVPFFLPRRLRRGFLAQVFLIRNYKWQICV